MTMNKNDDKFYLVLSWLGRDTGPDLVEMIERLTYIKDKIGTQRVFGSYRTERALQAAFLLGRQSLICHECGDYVPPDDAYCDCWRDLR